MSDLKRNLDRNINQLLSFFPVVLIVGARQVGKTTLAKSSRQSWKYYDLENGNDYDYISRDFDFFFRENPNHVIIDEAQELPRLFKELRGIIDANRSQKGRFILTGSSSSNLLSEASDSLAGRVGIIELGTMKMNELNKSEISPIYQILTCGSSQEQTLKNLKESNIKNNIDVIDTFLFGGYPEPVLSKDPVFFQKWMDNYYKTYINKDVRKLFPKLDFIKYRRFIDILSGLSGTIINKAEVGRSIDSSEVSVRDYLDIANNTLIWRLIPSYEKSHINSVVKMPKGIFRDNGLSHYLSGISNREQLLKHRNVGASFEGFIIEELIKGMQSTMNSKWDYYYYRTRSGSEVDLILEGPFGILPIEIKFGTHTPLKQLVSIKKFVKDNDIPLGVVINNSSEIKMLCDNVVQIPATAI